MGRGLTGAAGQEAECLLQDQEQGEGCSVAWCSVQGFGCGEQVQFGMAARLLVCICAWLLGSAEGTRPSQLCLHACVCVLLRVCKFLYDPQSELNHCVFKLFLNFLSALRFLLSGFPFQWYWVETFSHSYFLSKRGCRLLSWALVLTLWYLGRP